MTTIPTHRVAEVFVEVADTLVDEFDLIEFLQMVTSRIAELSTATAAGLLLADQRGRLSVMAATSREVQLVELFQVQAAEGPCQDCFTTGAVVTSADLAEAEDRWPRFAPAAVEAGFRSVHAFPLRLRREVIGALNLFSASPGGLEPGDARVIQALADVATIGLLQERAVRNSEVLTQQLQGAFNSRIVLEQAKGVLAQIHGETPDQAFDRMRAWSRSRRRRLGEVAEAVITRAESVAELLEPGQT